MPRFSLSDLPAGVLPPAGFRDQALTAPRWNQDKAKPGADEAPAPGQPGIGPSLTDDAVKTGSAYGNLGLDDGRDGDNGAVIPGLDDDFPADRGGDVADGSDSALVGPRVCGPMDSPKAAPVEEIASVPGRVCGPLDEATGNVALDKILAQFEGMSRWEIRQEMSDWDRADVRDFRQDFREEFGVGFAHADWLWG